MSGTLSLSVCQVNRCGGPRVMVGAGISANQRTDLIFFERNLSGVRYWDEILGPVVVPSLE